MGIPMDWRYEKQRGALERFSPLPLKQILLGLLAEAGMLKDVAEELDINTNTLSRWFGNVGLRVVAGEAVGVQTGKPENATAKALLVVRAALEVGDGTTGQ